MLRVPGLLVPGIPDPGRGVPAARIFSHKRAVVTGDSLSELWHFRGVLQPHHESVHSEHEGQPRGTGRGGALSHGQFRK